MSGLFTNEIKTDLEAQRRNREWIAALRSGKYQQGQNRLRFGSRYCCLGVACELFDPSRWVVIETDQFTYGPVELAGLPESVSDAFKLRDSLGSFNGGHSSLAGENDRGKTFAEIADVIERELDEALA